MKETAVSLSPDMAERLVSLTLPDGIEGTGEKRTWRHKFMSQVRQFSGCACAGMITQGGAHSLCIAFAAASGTGVGAVSQILSPLFEGNGIIGLSAQETMQFFVAPVLSVPASYAMERLRKGTYSLSKLGVAIGISFAVAAGLSTAFPHDHNTETGRIWFESQPQDVQEKIRTFANETSQTVDEVTQSLCSSDPNVRKRMEKLQKPPYTRVYEYIKG